MRIQIFNIVTVFTIFPHNYERETFKNIDI